MNNAALLAALSASKSSAQTKNASKEAKVVDGKEVVLTTIVKRYYNGVMKKYREYTFKDGSTKQEFIGDEEKPKYVKEQEEGFYRLKPGRFVGGKWVAEDAPKQGGSTGASTPSIKLINYNVWFSVLNQEERAKALLDTVQEQEPDVMCFQEATTKFLEILKKSEWIQQNYILSDVSGNSFRGGQKQYGVLTLVKTTAKDLDLHIYHVPSAMSRRPIASDFVLGAARVRIVNMHLESMEESETRQQQYKRCFEILQSAEAADLWIFTGDFNFDPETSKEKEDMPPGFVDAWLEKHGDTTNAFTFPAKKARLDRVLFKSDVYQVDHMEIIGKDPVVHIPGPKTPLNDFEGVLDDDTVAATKRPSDHYGVFTVFTPKKS